MHALSKTILFTTGSVGLLVLVFLWSALKYGLFKLNFLSETILNYKFAGFYLTDFLLVSSSLDAGQKIYLLKLFITGLIGIGSLILIVLSYLPRFSWQLRSLSLIVSLGLFAFLTLFWVCLKNGSEVIRSSEKSLIFSFTAITYLLGIFLLWYAMRAKSRKRLKNNIPEQKANRPALPKTSESKKENDSANDTSDEQKIIEKKSNNVDEKEEKGTDDTNDEQSTSLEEDKVTAGKADVDKDSTEEEEIDSQNPEGTKDIPEMNESPEEAEDAEISPVTETENVVAIQPQSDENLDQEAEVEVEGKDGEPSESEPSDEAKVA